ncbi:MAG TPA: hypothetical protein VGW58_14155 [Pyrinomonadaceae bacterium]|nr:hypothetical protein [Pyrinomonadaceae bacterium]
MAVNKLPTKFDIALRRLVRVGIMVVGLSHVVSIHAQEPKDKWRRVFTGEDSIIELNVSSPRFVPSHIMRVEFRTTFSKPEKLNSTSDLRYKSRLETIDFKLNEHRYRLFETTIMDEAGKALSSYKATTDDEWRIMKPGGVMERLFNAVRVLPPFGFWKIISYRFAEAGSTAGNTPELDRLIGTQVRLTADQAAVGTKICSLPDYQHKDATKDELARELGIQSVGVEGNVESIAVKCSGSGWTPPQSLLIKRSAEDMLMLWDGVFLMLKRDNDPRSTDSLRTLKRRTP